MQGSLKEVVNYSFSHRIPKHACSVGFFDESGVEKLVIGTTSDKLVLQNSESIFHINEPITFVDVLKPAKRIDTQYNCDFVVVGTEKSLLLFDVYNNKTVFHRDMPEGIHCIKIGTVDERKEPVIVCGCGSTIWGIDGRGEDVFWTTLGDDVNTLDLCDINDDGINELIVGTTGQEIKILKQQSLLKELIEGEPCVMIKALPDAKFAFGLSNGVIGVYRKWDRLWRIKTKYQISGLELFPPSQEEEVSYLACVWQNGKIDIREVEHGENVRKSQLDGDVVGTVVTEARPDQGKRAQLLCVYYNGRGIELHADVNEPDQELSVLHDFSQRKHNLMEELKNFEATDRKESTSQVGIPINTQMDCILDLSLERGLLLHIKITNDIPIRSVLMFAEGIFPSECFAIHPNMESPELSAIIKPVKNSATDILIRVLIGASGSSFLRIMEFDRSLPRFCSYVFLHEGAPEPAGFVDLEINARAEPLCGWLIDNFLINEESAASLMKEDKWKVTLKCCYTGEVLQMEILDGGRLKIRHNKIEFAGEIVQSLVQTLDIRQMTSRANFPLYQAELNDLIASMEDRYTMNDKLTAEWTERLNFIRETVVRAEDALLTDQCVKARKLYVRVAMLNRECVAQRQILATSMEGLVGALKRLNNLIKQNAQLKVGEDANELVKECRKLLASENFVALGKRLQFSSN